MQKAEAASPNMASRLFVGMWHAGMEGTGGPAWSLHSRHEQEAF